MRMPYGMDLDTFKHLESTGELNTVLQLLQTVDMCRNITTFLEAARWGCNLPN